MSALSDPSILPPSLPPARRPPPAPPPALPPPVPPPRVHAKRKPLPPGSRVSALSALNNSRFPDGGRPPSPPLPVVQSAAYPASKVRNSEDPDIANSKHISRASSSSSRTDPGAEASALSRHASQPSVSSLVSSAVSSGSSSPQLSLTSTALSTAVSAAAPSEHSRAASFMSTHTNSSTASAAYLAMSRPVKQTNKADYTRYLRRQKATVWSELAQRDLLTKHPRASGHKEKDKAGKKAKDDEYSKYTHAYAYYHPKLDMTLELSDARVVDNTKPSRFSVRGSEEYSPKPGSSLAPSSSSASTTTLAAIPTNSTGPTNAVSEPRDAVEPDPESEKTVASENTPAMPESLETAAYKPTESDLAPDSSRSRSISVGSLDDSVVTARRTLYIVNPDYSSSGEE